MMGQRQSRVSDIGREAITTGWKARSFGYSSKGESVLQAGVEEVEEGREVREMVVWSEAEGGDWGAAAIQSSAPAHF